MTNGSGNSCLDWRVMTMSTQRLSLGRCDLGHNSDRHIHLYVEDVLATFAKAIAVGATVVRGPTKADGDDDLRGGVQDVWGVTWWNRHAAAAALNPA